MVGALKIWNGSAWVYAAGVAPETRNLPSYVDPSVLSGNFDPKLSMFNQKGSNTRLFRAAAAKAIAGIAPLEIVYIGDSFGAGATSLTTWDRPHSPPMAMRNEIARRGIPISGTGFVRCADSGATSIDSRWSYSGTGWNANGKWFVFTGVLNDQATFTSDRAGDKVKLTYLDHNDGCVFTISVDGATSGAGFTTVTCSGPSVAMESVELTVPVDIGSTVAVKRTSATGAVYLDLVGIQIYDSSTPGLVVHNLAQSGSLASGTGLNAWSDNTSNANALGHLLDNLAHVTAYGGQPALVIIGLGGNDKQTSQGPYSDATVLTNLATIRGRFASSDAMFIAEPQLNSTYTPYATWEAWLKSLYEWCNTNNYPLFDIMDRLGGYTTVVTNGQSSDGVGHLLGEVAEVMGRTLGTALAMELGNTEAPKIRVVPDSTTGFADEHDNTIWIEYTQ